MSWIFGSAPFDTNIVTEKRKKYDFKAFDLREIYKYCYETNLVIATRNMISKQLIKDKYTNNTMSSNWFSVHQNTVFEWFNLYPEEVCTTFDGN